MMKRAEDKYQKTRMEATLSKKVRPKVHFKKLFARKFSHFAPLHIRGISEYFHGTGSFSFRLKKMDFTYIERRLIGIENYSI